MGRYVTKEAHMRLNGRLQDEQKKSRLAAERVIKLEAVLRDDIGCQLEGRCGGHGGYCAVCVALDPELEAQLEEEKSVDLADWASCSIHETTFPAGDSCDACTAGIGEFGGGEVG